MKYAIALIITIGIMSFNLPAEQTVSIKLTIPQAQTILKALAKLPYEESAALISEITIQAQKQLSDTTKKK